MQKGKFDSNFKPDGDRKVFCPQIPSSIVAKAAYLPHSNVDLSLASFSTTAVYLRHSAQVQRILCADAQLQGLRIVLMGLPYSARDVFHA